MTSSERVRQLRRELGLTQAELGSLCAYTQSNISAIERGKSELGRGAAEALAPHLDVTPAYLLYGDEEKPNPGLIRGVLAIIPSAGHAAADASGGPLFDLNDKGDDLVLPDSLRSVKVVSDSMAPVINRGQHVLIDLEAVPADGDLVVVEMRDGRRLFKRFFAHSKRIIELQTANPVHPEPAMLLKQTQIRRIIVVAGACYQ